jgi:hypothetical protein
MPTVYGQRVFSGALTVLSCLMQPSHKLTVNEMLPVLRDKLLLSCRHIQRILYGDFNFWYGEDMRGLYPYFKHGLNIKDGCIWNEQTNLYVTNLLLRALSLFVALFVSLSLSLSHTHILCLSTSHMKNESQVSNYSVPICLKLQCMSGGAYSSEYVNLGLYLPYVLRVKGHTCTWKYRQSAW